MRLVSLALLAAGTLAATFPVTGPGARTKWQGRYVPGSDGGATFDWPGVRVEFVVRATTTVSATIVCPGPLIAAFRVYVDGVNASSVLASAASESYTLASGLDASRDHTIMLYSFLESALQHPQPFLPSPPYTAPSLVSVTVDGSLAAPPPASPRSLVFVSVPHTLPTSSTVVAPQPRAAPLQVGDSITVGFGSGGQAGSCPNPAIYSEDNSRTYGNLLCGNFSADCETVAWSGKGLYVNSPTAGTNQTLPSYYLQLLGAGQEPYVQTWNASGRPTPSAVFVHLGTNVSARPPSCTPPHPPTP